MELHEALRRRRMVRNFQPTPVAAAALDRLIEAARRAPSAGHTQATDLLVLDGPEETGRYWDVTLPPGRREGFRWPGLLRAPVLILPCVDAAAYVERYGEPDKASTGLGAGVARWPVPYWHVDGGMAVMALLLTAVDLGLGALFFGLFEREAEVREAFGIPERFQPVGSVAVGHPAPDEPGRSAGRARRAVAETVHRGRWRP